jgi:enhancing lycopene biosynthesis protein 2
MSQANAKRVGVVLSGCGFLDGAEIHEAVLTLLALDRAGAQIRAAAPNMPQLEVVDHLRGAPADAPPRNVLLESARITRGEIVALEGLDPGALDAVIFPGGYGVAKNLTTYATAGTDLAIRPEVEQLVRACADAGKPMGFICIAPVIAAKVLGPRRPRLTIGKDSEAAAALEALGAVHVPCDVDQIVLDEQLKLVSTPAYMLGPSIARVAQGIDRLVEKVLALA